jgi:hypothetical protein
MARPLALVAACAALALAGCASNQAVADRRCSAVAGPSAAHDQCVALELDKMAKANKSMRSSGGAGY